MVENVTSERPGTLERKAGRRFWLHILIAVAGGFAVYIALSFYADISAVVRTISGFRWSLVPLILLLTLANYALRFVKWHYYLHVIKVPVGIKDSLVVFLSGLSMSVTPVKLGEVFKAFLLKQRCGTEVSRVVPVVLVERVTDVLGLLVLASISFSFFRYGLEVLLVVLAALVALIAVLNSRTLCQTLIRFSHKLPLVSRWSDGLLTAYESARVLFRLVPLFVAVVISTVSWSFECLALQYVLQGFGVSPSLATSVFVFSFSSLVGAVSMLPGGMLVAEGSITGLLILYGVTRDVAAGATIIIRFATLWFGVLVGAITLLATGLFGKLKDAYRA